MEFENGGQIECVYIPANYGGALCVSSQIGCKSRNEFFSQTTKDSNLICSFSGSLACTFCHTGTQKLLRNLKAEEILAQILSARSNLNEFGLAMNQQRKLSHIVFMGQGEPLYNFKEVSKAIIIASNREGLAFPLSKITLSTSGVVPLIEKVGSELGIKLAISLHASTDELR